MLVLFPPIFFFMNTKIIFGYNFRVPLRFLVAEIIKNKSKSNPEFSLVLLQLQKHIKLTCNLRRSPALPLARANSGTNSVHFKGTSIWNNLIYLTNSIASVSEFKTNLKTLGNIGCSYLTCTKLAFFIALECVDL